MSRQKYGNRVIRRAGDDAVRGGNSRDDRAAHLVAEVIERGGILKAYNPLDHEETTVGPYHEAVDRNHHFAVIGWRTGRESYARTSRDAAMRFVSRVGSTRAREAAQRYSR